MSQKDLETKININADASQARNEIGKFEAGFTRTLKGMGKSATEIKALRTLAREIREGAKSTDDLDKETRELVTTYNKLRAVANDRNLLGVRSHQKVREEIAKVEGAYKRLKASGTLSSRELAQAAAATKQRVKALRGEMELTTKKAGKLGGAFGGLKTVMTGFLAGLGLRQLIQTNREFEKMRASLETVTGSAEDADQAFAAIQEFASKTPYSVGEVTNSFIKLTALGLQPSEKALTSYGNTASAMGKSLDQMIEAVADATTGEFERLKEFGIKAKSEGDKVALTFRGTTTTIGKNAGEIEEYLTRLGKVEFAGGMERQVDTLNGAISNLGDAWDRFLDRMLNDEGSSALGSAVTGFADALTWVSTEGIGHFQGAIVAGIATIQNWFSRLEGTAKISWAGIQAVGEGAINILKERVADFAGTMAEAFDTVGADETAASWKRLADSVRPAEGAYEKFRRKTEEINAEVEREIAIRDEAAMATIQSIQADIKKSASLDKLAKAEKDAAKNAEKTAKAFDALGVKSAASIQKAQEQISNSFDLIVSSADASGDDIVAAFDAALAKINTSGGLEQLAVTLKTAFDDGKISVIEYDRKIAALQKKLTELAKVDLTRAFNAGEVSVDEYIKKLAALEKQQVKLAKASQSRADAQGKEAGATKKVAGSTGDHVDALIDLAKQYRAGDISAEEYWEGTKAVDEQNKKTKESTEEVGDATEDAGEKAEETGKKLQSVSVDMAAFAQSMGVGAQASQSFSKVYARLKSELEESWSKQPLVTVNMYLNDMKRMERQAIAATKRLEDLDRKMANLGNDGASGVEDMRLRLLELEGTEAEIARARQERERNELRRELEILKIKQQQAQITGDDAAAAGLRKEAQYKGQELSLLSQVQAAEERKRRSEQRESQQPVKETKLTLQGPDGQPVSGMFAEQDAERFIQTLQSAGMRTVA